MFAANSRYAGLQTYSVTMPDGSVVTATRLPSPSSALPAGYHQRRQGDRLDLLAARYLNDPTAFWRLCDANDAVAPDTLNARDLIGIPQGPAGL
jgi:hypothetical protein